MTTSDDSSPFSEPVEIEITDVFDLHTIPPRQVKAVVEEYLREAHRKGFRVVRIIHGKGIGVQREMVRAILARTSLGFCVSSRSLPSHSSRMLLILSTNWPHKVGVNPC